MADTLETMGPISYLIVEFPGSNMTGDGLLALVDLVERGAIRVLDLLFVNRDHDGNTTVIDISDIDNDGALDLTIFEGATSGLLDESDAADAAAAIKPGSSAAVLLFENTWAMPLIRGLRSGGAELVAAGYIPVDRLVEALDEDDAR